MMIIAGWGSSLAFLLSVDATDLPAWMTMLAVFFRSFLTTGLFIVSHDAMHGTLVPSCSHSNDFVGKYALLLYAFLPYGYCKRNHQHHHSAPGSINDPDFHSIGSSNPLSWYLRFMGGYLSIPQLLVMIIIWGICGWFLSFQSDTAYHNIVLFWILPLLISSLQLFFFGTFLPHRSRQIVGPVNGPPTHEVSSLYMPELFSFLACFHFGCHREHHQYPELPWHQLHAAAAAELAGTLK
jgi:beta-carotene/zeaxanthin 4-ketolase